jgi:hypothetical protein
VSFAPFPPWRWETPERFNIGVACLDRHLGTPVAGRAAMIVEDDIRGTSQATTPKLAARTSCFGQLLRSLIGAGDRVLIRCPTRSTTDRVPRRDEARRTSVPTSTLLTPERCCTRERLAGRAIIIDKAAWATFGRGSRRPDAQLRPARGRREVTSSPASEYSI